MGAKVGNMGGGMVELFTLEWTDSGSRDHTHQMTQNEMDLMGKYQFLVFRGKLIGSSGREDYFSNAVDGKILKDFFDKSSDKNYFYCGSMGSSSEDGAWVYFRKRTDNVCTLYAHGAGSWATVATSTVEILGFNL